MKMLVFTTLFPNSKDPTHGVFVKERVRHYTKRNDVVVVAPVPFYIKIKNMLKGTPIPSTETISSMTVHHPTYFYIPKYFKFLDGLFLYLSSVILVRRMKKQHDFSIIDSHYCFPDGFAAVLLGKTFDVPVSITLRGNDVSLLPIYRARKLMIRYALENAVHLIAVSEWLKKKAEKILIAPKKIHVVMNSVDQEAFRPMEKMIARREMGIKENGKILLSVGAMIERKGFHHLIRAFQQVKVKYSEELFLFIAGGHGGEKNFTLQLKNLVSNLNLEENVKFLGPVPHDKLIYLYNSADLFCLFSEREGCPNVLMEATACGIPSVVCGEWADRYMIPSDGIGYISPSRNTSELGQYMLSALLKNWDRAAIRSYSASNSWEKVEKITKNIYEI